MSINTSGIEKGFGIAFTAVGASIALGALDDLTKRVGKKKTSKSYRPMFEPMKFKKIKW